jgi:hypothetical protein
LVAPSRIDRNQLNQIKFSGLEFLDNCFVCPPIYRISQINNKALTDFWFRIDNGVIAENMQEFGNFVHDHILEVQNKKVQAPVTLQPITSTNFVKPASQLSGPIQTRENPIDPVQKEFSFIPFFLRKK